MLQVGVKVLYKPQPHSTIGVFREHIGDEAVIEMRGTFRGGDMYGLRFDDEDFWWAMPTDIEITEGPW